MTEAAGLEIAIPSDRTADESAKGGKYWYPDSSHNDYLFAKDVGWTKDYSYEGTSYVQEHFDEMVTGTTSADNVASVDSTEDAQVDGAVCAKKVAVTLNGGAKYTYLCIGLNDRISIVGYIVKSTATADRTSTYEGILSSVRVAGN